MLDKKVCLITGACGGIGQCIVKRFLKEGCHVAMIDLNEDRLDSTVREEGYDPADVGIYAIDITDEDAVKEGVAGLRFRQLPEDL